MLRIYVFYSLAILALALNLYILFETDDEEFNLPYTTLKKVQPTNFHREDPRLYYGDPVGTLNGYDLYYVDKAPETKIHCVGDTFQPNAAWNYRSCEYQLLCFDLGRHEFVVYGDSLSSNLPSGWYSSTLRDKNSATNVDVNAMSRNVRASSGGEHGGIFQPSMRDENPPSSYYFLDVAMIPFFRYYIGFRNPGHLLWQDLVSIYKLLETFGREEEQLLLVPLKRHIAKEYYRKGNADLMNKFGAKLMGMPSFNKYYPYWEDGNLTINISQEGATIKRNPPKTVCTKYGLTGMSEFGTHATHHHNGTHYRRRFEKIGKINQLIQPQHNGGGAFFRRMRKFMMKNIGIENDRDYIPHPSLILFSQNSSGRGKRANQTFHLHIDHLRSVYPQNDVRVEGVTFAKLGIEEQVKLVSRTRVLATTTGGGTATAIFLPPGAHLILFYEQWFLDWDYWNNMPDIHVHWVPVEHAEDASHLPDLKLLFDECLGMVKAPGSLKFTSMAAPAIQQPEKKRKKEKQTQDVTSLGLCDGYDGILYISQVFKKAATGTFFFQSIVDSLLYAEEHNLYPFIWVDKVGNSQPCLDHEVHGRSLNSTHIHLAGVIKNVFRQKDKESCSNEPGAPSFDDLRKVRIDLLGNGIWQTYFQSKPIPFNDDSCRKKPVFEMELSQILPGMHYCSEHAVRGWVYPNMARALGPEAKNQSMHEWLSSNRKRASTMVEKYFDLQPWLADRIKEVNQVGEGGRCLGVHIRLTDKGSGRDKKGIEAYMPYLESYVNNTKGTGKIFLAADDSRVLDDLVSSSSVLDRSMIGYQTDVLLSSSKYPTFSKFKSQHHRLNTETLVDIYGLSKCTYLVHGYSAVSEAAIYINPEFQDFSVNIDDEHALSPVEFGKLVRRN